MKVILSQDIPDLGKKNEIREVKDGYGRNFLVRKKLAKIATPQLEKQLTIQRERLKKDTAELRQKSLTLKEKLEKYRLVFKVRVGDSGKVFGSITPSKVLAELKKQGIHLDKRQILTEPIKTLGENKFKIKLPQDIEAKINIVIESENAK